MLNDDTIRTAQDLGRYLYQSRFTLVEAVAWAKGCEWAGVPWSEVLGRAVMCGWMAERRVLMADLPEQMPEQWRCG